jgi:large subunit ribosomal protein L29
MSIADLKNMDDKALVHRELQLERELLDAQFRLKTNQLEDTSKVAKLRKGIARARTVQRERELEQSLNPNTLRDMHRGTFVVAKLGAGGDGAAGGFLKGIVDKVTPAE